MVITGGVMSSACPITTNAVGKPSWAKSVVEIALSVADYVCYLHLYYSPFAIEKLPKLNF